MNIRQRFSLVSLVFLGAVLVPAPAVAQADFSLKIKAAGLSEDDRDLGTDPAVDTETREGYLDVQPQLHSQYTPNFASFLRVQGFVPSGMVREDQYGEPVPVESYGALREAWFEYGGLTSYPGEVLRLGLQRLREPDGIWYDRDIETARWIFDTTLFQFQMGAAKAFNTYRTDDVELSASQKDRAYGFAGIGTQWVPRNFVGARVAYGTDQRDLPANGTQLEPDGGTDPVTGQPTYREPQLRDLGWFGVFLDNRFYEWERGPGVAYRVEVIGMRGEIQRSTADPTTGQVNGATTSDVDAVGGDAGLRFRFPAAFPLTFGGAYAYGRGGRDANGQHDFYQTGLHSNRSRFTGTRTVMNRFNEALQAELTNLRVVSALISLPMPSWDFSLVGHRFERDDPTRPVITDGVDVQPDRTNGSTDLGTGWDFVFTKFLQGDFRGYSLEDDRRSNVRLRASRFTPGEAYGSQLQDQNRVVLEATLWF
jgi:alginate production protein